MFVPKRTEHTEIKEYLIGEKRSKVTNIFVVTNNFKEINKTF